jgi:peptide-methionine (R)-S-oxide reductase
VCCGQPLFDAATKYDSRSGWPSFYDPIAPDAIATESDRSLAVERTEVLCSRCDATWGTSFPTARTPPASATA